MKTADLIGVKILNPVFHWLDHQIHENGDYLFLAFYYAMMILIRWILCGGLRRKNSPGKTSQLVRPVIIIRLPSEPPPSAEHFDQFPRRTKNHRAAITTTIIARTECGQAGGAKSRA